MLSLTLYRPLENVVHTAGFIHTAAELRAMSLYTCSISWQLMQEHADRAASRIEVVCHLSPKITPQCKVSRILPLRLLALAACFA